MNGRRILINVAVFALLSVALTGWALAGVVRFDFVERPYTISAEFTSSPGLHENFEVAYLGIRVGKIRSLRLDAPHHMVVAELAIDRGVRIPAELTAAAGRKSAVGEPYVDLAPRPGTDLGRHIEPGGRITKEHTSVPVAYGDLFAQVIDGLKAIDPASTKILFRELAAGWEGREDSLRQIVDGSAALTEAFVGRTELIDGLTGDLSELTRSLAGRPEALGSSIDNAAALLGPLSDLRAELREVLERSPALTTRLADLTTATDPYLGCAVGALDDALGTIATPAKMKDVRETLGMAGTLISALDDIIRPTSAGPALNLSAVISTKGEAPLEYRDPIPQPTVPEIPECASGADPFKAPAPSEKSEQKRQTEAAAPSPTTPATTSTAVARPVAEASPGGPPGWLVWLPPVLALAVLARVAAKTLPVLIRRRSR
ncbi:phospholipid/cholesterol/gamma-HCH transport system substrate-binding protein [Actinocorallia herbida]|uniref:Phospholipid/cholesterol/gamma-HCH transport system substrate-binding protein n=1 Tax=Actinocorallia herbida TaxID=58109 RepID=A0A3N1D872_9ACTN|nr:MlaD family protein [Actinocorallia herbida]ROO89747.1 phospholipid/cholesterol/gamma-HCH transport system substrate-binding protein [Actinocorallia herbida]